MLQSHDMNDDTSDSTNDGSIDIPSDCNVEIIEIRNHPHSRIPLVMSVVHDVTYLPSLSQLRH
jgi:hypothetical protein